MSRTVPENDDTVAWPVHHAAATINSHCTGTARTNTGPKRQELSTSGCTILAESRVDGDRHRTRVGSARRDVGVKAFSHGFFGADQGANRLCGGGTGNQARARRKRLGRGALFERERAATQATRPDDQGQRADNTDAGRSSFANRRAGGDGGQKEVPSPRRVYIRLNEIRKYVKLQDVSVVLHCSSWSRTSRRTQEKEGEVAPGPDEVVSQSNSGAGVVCGDVHDFGGTLKTVEDAGVPSLQDFVESRPAQSAHGDVYAIGRAEVRSVRGCRSPSAEGDLRQVAICSTSCLRLFST